MKIGPKYKICRRLGSSVFEKCQTQKYTLSESKKKGTRSKRPKALSDMGKQLLEKQKIRFTYGITHKQLGGYVKRVDTKKEMSPDIQLISMLERRLDNAVFKLGLASTRRMARQLVSHGHITVNGRKVTIPSFELSVGNVLAIREGSKDKKVFAEIKESIKEVDIPTWIDFDLKKMEAKIVSKPDESSKSSAFDPTMIIEYYSR